MLKWLDSLLDRLFALTGGLLAMQIPAFIRQYTQRVSAGYGELNLHLTQIQKLAGLNGKTLDQYVQKFLLSRDPDFSSQGQFIQQLMQRIHDLKQQLFFLENANWLSRPFYLLAHLDHSIAADTIEHFEPGLQFSGEALAYALAGTAFGLALYNLLKKAAGTCLSQASIRIR